MYRLGKGAGTPVSASFEITSFDTRMALDVVEDTLTALDTEADRGYAVGLCGGFYLCALLSQAEWESYLARIEERRRRVR